MKVFETKEPAPHTLEEIFNFHYGDKLKADIQIIDNLCLKFKVNPEDFWSYYRTQIGDFSGADFLLNLLEYFYFHLETKIDKLTKPEGVSVFGWFYFEKNQIVLSEDGEDEFKNLINLPYESKKRLMENNLFEFFMKEVEQDIFSATEKRRMKLEKLK